MATVAHCQQGGTIAQSVARSPVSELRIYSSDERPGHGRLDLKNGTAASICAASTTGRFLLRVISSSGGRLLGADARGALEYDVLFSDGTGAMQVKKMVGGQVAFEGRSPGQTDCSRGANATVRIKSAEPALLRSVAGAYSDRITLSIDPL